MQLEIAEEIFRTKKKMLKRAINKALYGGLDSWSVFPHLVIRRCPNCHRTLVNTKGQWICPHCSMASSGDGISTFVRRSRDSIVELFKRGSSGTIRNKLFVFVLKNGNLLVC